MKILKSAIIIFIAALLTSCSTPAAENEISEINEYLLPSELPQEALDDLEFLAPYIEKNVSKINYGFLYVEDENGKPVENLKCYNEGQWYVEGMEGAGKHSSTSMPGGIIPVSLIQEDEKVYLTIVNEEAESFIFENIEADYERLLNGEIYKAVWKHETPEESVLKSKDYVTINISSSPKYDMSRFTVQVVPYYEQQEAETDPEGETNPAMGMGFAGTIKVDSIGESNPQIGNFEKIRLYYIGKEGTVMIKAENIPESERIKFIIAEMDPHIIAVPNMQQWEFVFENTANKFSLNLE